MLAGQKHKASVVFEPEVMEYLEELQERLDRDRSWLINALVRDHRRREREGQTQIELFDRSAQLAVAGRS
jgi:predicted transcriptional regulator